VLDDSQSDLSLVSSVRVVRRRLSVFATSDDCPHSSASGRPRPGRLLSPLLSILGAAEPRPDGEVLA
jgi:hypothetical protein